MLSLGNIKEMMHHGRMGEQMPNFQYQIETLPSPQLPATAEDLKTFACERCKYVRCIVRHQDGSVCGKERRPQARAQARVHQKDYQCGECQTWLHSQKTLKEAVLRQKSGQ